MAICRICGAETDGDELCAECAENDRGGDVDGQLTLFGGEVGAAAVQRDSDSDADASDTGSASIASGAINTADASRTTDAEDVFTSGTVDAFDSVDALKAFGAGNADIVGTQTDSTQISGAHPNSAHTDKTPSDGTQTGNTATRTMMRSYAFRERAPKRRAQYTPHLQSCCGRSTLPRTALTTPSMSAMNKAGIPMPTCKPTRK